MKPKEFWTHIYENYYDKDKSILSENLRNLFYYIDMIYYVQNGGASGFVYNMSPTKSVENQYLPYIKSLTFFGFTELSTFLSIYNNQYQQALLIWEQDKEQNFSDILDDQISTDFTNKLNEQLDDIIDNSESVSTWIQTNMIKLKQELANQKL